MKKYYIAPATDISICSSSDIMIGAMDMSDPGFQNPYPTANEIVFDDNETDIVHWSNTELWSE